MQSLRQKAEFDRLDDRHAKWLATHSHVEVRELEQRREPRTRPKFRYEARVIGHRR